jgi:hypothetical protein
MSFDGHEQTEASREQETVERRAAIRRGAALLAGATGLGVAAAAAAPSASAAPGDAVLQGATNDAGATTTTLTSSAGSGTLALSNTGTGAPLRVAATTIRPDAPTAGDHRTLGDDGWAIPLFSHVTGLDPEGLSTGLVFTDIWAMQPIPVIPQRALDTRTAAGRARVLDPAGKFDSTGRLLAGKTITLSLDQYVFAIFGGGVLGNLTVTGSLAGGHLVLYSEDPRPPVSSVNYVTGQTIANFSFTGLDFTGTDTVVRIFALSTTHVIFDITGFAVGSIFFINPEILPSPAARASAINVAAAPKWFRDQQARFRR